MQSVNRRRLILIVAGLTLLFLVVVAILAPRHPAKKPQTNPTNSVVDPLSHKTVSNPSGVAPEHYGSNPELPIYLGFDKLLNYGLSSEQVFSLQVAFYNYTQTVSPPVTQVSVGVDTISTDHDAADPNSPFFISFDVGFNGNKAGRAKVDYSDLELKSVRLYLTDNSGKQVFDSGVVDGSAGSD
ncbi:MAG TPA: hypothetical protein VMT23_01980 [Candidatus Binatia bacterium]|nr:hypothetical protein [Candidatus Binatia bacterium]